MDQKTPRMGNNNVEVLGKWANGVASEKALPYHFDSGGLITDCLAFNWKIAKICLNPK